MFQLLSLIWGFLLHLWSFDWLIECSRYRKSKNKSAQRHLRVWIKASQHRGKNLPLFSIFSTLKISGINSHSTFLLKTENSILFDHSSHIGILFHCNMEIFMQLIKKIIPAVTQLFQLFVKRLKMKPWKSPSPLDGFVGLWPFVSQSLIRRLERIFMAFPTAYR